MPAPFNFPSETDNIGLPLLFAGQAQKEFFVNQAFSLIDAMLRFVVIDSVSAPPSGAVDGSAYRVTAPATLDWENEEGAIAIRIGEAWHFVPPFAGMMVFDQTAEKLLVFRAQWESGTIPAVPTGGAVIDTEARVAIAEISDELERLGILG